MHRSASIAKGGALKGRKGTIFNKKPIRQENQKKFGVEIVNAPIVVDGNITTSRNPSSALNVTFQLLENLAAKKSRPSKTLNGVLTKIRLNAGWSVQAFTSDNRIVSSKHFAIADRASAVYNAVRHKFVIYTRAPMICSHIKRTKSYVSIFWALLFISSACQADNIEINAVRDLEEFVVAIQWTTAYRSSMSIWENWGDTIFHALYLCRTSKFNRHACAEVEKTQSLYIPAAGYSSKNNLVDFKPNIQSEISGSTIIEAYRLIEQKYPNDEFVPEKDMLSLRIGYTDWIKNPIDYDDPLNIQLNILRSSQTRGVLYSSDFQLDYVYRWSKEFINKIHTSGTIQILRK